MWKNCPHNINSSVGYRTKRSMKNMETWKYAHDYCGRHWLKMGTVSIIPSIILMILFYNGTDNSIGIAGGAIVVIQLILLICSIIPTEKALKENFPD